MAKPTPGPWKVNSRNVWQVCDDDGERRGCSPIATMRGTNAEKRANAALIAAAPELYAQLEFAVKLLGGLPGFAGTAQIESMRAALAKAVSP